MTEEMPMLDLNSPPEFEDILVNVAIRTKYIKNSDSNIFMPKTIPTGKQLAYIVKTVEKHIRKGEYEITGITYALEWNRVPF